MSDATKSAAWLNILSADLLADEMIQAAGIEPDRKWNVNDPIPLTAKGRRPSSGLYYRSPLDDERPATEHVHALVERLGRARAGLIGLKRRFQSYERSGTIQLTIYAFDATESIGFPLNVEDLAFFADVCTSVLVTVGREPVSVVE